MSRRGGRRLQRVRSRNGAGDRLKTAWERAEEKRQAKLEVIREQVENGSLVIRQMTDEERLRYPPRPTAQNGAKRSRAR